MKIGFDFDNTIVNYDNLFKLLLKKKYNISNLENKDQVKNFFFKKKKIKEWKNIQSIVYSDYIFKAKPNKNILKIMKFLDKKNINFYIVSHKTKYPYYGEKKKLHNLSKKWLDEFIFNKKNRFRKKYKVFFETTEKKKIRRIKKLELTHFIDDLIKILKKLPPNIKKIHFKKNMEYKKIKSLVVGK